VVLAEHRVRNCEVTESYVAIDIVEAQFEQGEHVAAVANAAVKIVGSFKKKREVFFVFIRRDNCIHILNEVDSRALLVFESVNALKGHYVDALFVVRLAIGLKLFEFFTNHYWLVIVYELGTKFANQFIHHSERLFNSNNENKTRVR
jgi:hypothetical protein